MSVRFPLAFLLGVAAAVLVACGSGGSSDKLLPPRAAARIKSDLAAIRSAVSQQACQAAQSALQDFNRDLDRLSTSVDPRLRRNLRQGYDRLVQRVPIDCQQPTTTTTTVPTTTTTAPTTTQTTPTATETTPTTPTSTTPTTPTTPPQTTTTDGGSGNGGVTAP